MKYYLSLAILFLLVGCGSNDVPQTRQIAVGKQQSPPEFSYASPTAKPVRAKPFVVDGSIPEVVDRVVGALRQSGFAIAHVDEQAGIVTATFRADPDDYVDCGTLTFTSEDDDALAMSAASSRLRYDVALDDNGAIGTIDRMMILDGRAIVEVKPSGFSVSSVNTSADYVLTRMAVLRVAEQDRPKKRKQFLAFGSGQAAHFEEGSTVCQSNGKLERETLRPDDLNPSLGS